MKGSLSIVLATPAEDQRIFTNPQTGSRFIRYDEPRDGFVLRCHFLFKWCVYNQ